MSALKVMSIVALGGGLGSLARHGVNMMFARLLARHEFYATATVNLAGSAVIGVLAGLIASGRLTMGPAWRLFVFVGVLGGFTTFSSFMLDSLTLTRAGERTLALSNIAGQTAVGFLAVYFGYLLAVR